MIVVLALTAGSLADIVALTTRSVTVAEINQIFTDEADSDRYGDIIGVTHDPIVSADVIGDPHAALVDLGLTQVVDGDLVKVMSWSGIERSIALESRNAAVGSKTRC